MGDKPQVAWALCTGGPLPEELANHPFVKKCESELARLPRWARVAFAVRCARRIQQAAEHGHDAIEEPISIAEEAAAKGERVGSFSVGELSAPLDNTILTVANCALVAAGCKDDDALLSGENAGPVRFAGSLDYAVNAAAYTAGVATRLQAENPSEVLLEDLATLTAASHEEAWTAETPVPLHFYAMRTTFERAESAGGIINVGQAIDARLVEYFRTNPQAMYELDSRRFEELVAELFTGFGFSVELTARTRDQGRDVIAVGRGPVSSKILVECKRYAPQNTVGIGLVRSLHGVVEDEGASHGVLATTSKFTRPALEHIERNRWMLEGRDFDGLVEWLERYQRALFEKFLRLR